jgi:FkbM family methyltransferase
MLTTNNFRNWVPIARPTPANNFIQRSIRKWLFIAHVVISTIGPRLGFFGARVVGVTPNGHTLLKLNKGYALGGKGTVLELPRDRGIYEDVRRRGVWELEESKFLARGLKNAYRNPQIQKVALIDIGAHTGLVTLQAMNLSNTAAEVFLFEPVASHALAIKRNLRKLPNIHVCNFALSNKNGSAIIFSQASNLTNTSLLKSVVPEVNRIPTQVQLVHTTTFFAKFLKNFDGYVIKSDIQGMDAQVLSMIPAYVWKNCELAVVEVWALNLISKKHVDALFSMWQEFKIVGWINNNVVEIIQLSSAREFWLSKSGSYRNLVLSKTHFQD